jgi:hypothetical protein
MVSIVRMIRAGTVPINSSSFDLAFREDNKLRPEDRGAHDWYRFVLSFPPHLVREYLHRFGLSANHRVLDPFCGTGTTLVESKKLGIPSVGIEANPMAFFASEVKVDWEVDPDGLLRHARMVAKRTLEKLKGEGIDDDRDGLPLFHPPRKDPLRLRTLSADTWKLLLRDSISPLPLHKTLVLLETLEKEKHERYSRHERLALAKALVFGISNLHFGPEVGVRPAKRDAPVVATWMRGVLAMVEDLEELHHGARTEVSVHRADSRSLSKILKPSSVDAVITSPPYPEAVNKNETLPGIV